MKSYKMNDSSRFYNYPGEREEIRQNHKHKMSCNKNRKKRKSK